MLTEYQLTNFKAFGETVTIPIRPITLIFGPNSSGKSSILQSLLMLKQTIEKCSNLDSLISNGAYVDLGSYQELVHASPKAKGDFSFRMTFKNFEGALSGQAIHFLDYDGNDFESRSEYYAQKENWDLICNNMAAYIHEISLSNSYGSKDKDSKDNMLIKQEFFLGKSQNPFWTKTQNDGERFAEEHEHGYYQLWKKLDNSMRTEIDRPLLIEAFDQVGHQEDTDNLIDNIEKNKIRYKEYPVENFYKAFPDAGKALLPQALSKIEYIPPLREYPQRYYFYDGSESNLYFKLEDKPLLKKVNDALKKLYADETQRIRIKISHIIDKTSKIRVALAPKIENIITKKSSSIRDVGFGISQILPIVIDSCALKEKMLLIEQPELHLHPALQAEMADLFINSALGEQKNGFLIETHSEHLILRLLRRIRETTAGTLPDEISPIKPDDISVVYIQPGNNGSDAIPLKITPDGDFASDWPCGFFTEREKELF